MHIDRRLLGWGVFFLLVGIVPLAVREGLVSGDAVRGWWRAWPLLVVAVGIGLVLARTPFAFLGGLLAAATLGLMLGGILAGGISLAGCGDRGGRTPFPAQEGTLRGDAHVELALSCGDLTVAVRPMDAWRVEGANARGEAPEIESQSDRLVVRSRSTGPFDPLAARESWTVALPSGPTLDLDVTVNAGAGTLDLGGATVRRLAADVNAGELRLDLGEIAGVDALDLAVNAGTGTVRLPDRSVRGSLSVNAGTIRLRAPAGAGLRITTNDNLTAGNNFGANGLSKAGNTWETPSFASAPVQIVLDAAANAGSFELNPSGGCNG